ncbi:MAG: flagellar biosynthetic protein FliO [Cellvibrionales bacterium]|nr:flagellar biosynthetic protein FliO [Cellvibrionales bacterium]
MITRFAIALLALVTAINIAAADAVIDKPSVAPVFSGTSVIQVILSLAFVIVLIYAVAWYVRRLQLTTSGTGQSMRVVSALSVGTREKVVLVQVGEEQLLLGVAPGRVNVLRQFEGVAIEAKESGLRTGFAKILNDTQLSAKSASSPSATTVEKNTSNYDGESTAR